MDLDQQIKVLIENAPQDGTTPQVVEAIAPALKTLAEQLEREEYFILQSLDQSWVLTTLVNIDQPKVKKRVIYAFPTLEDALSTADPALGDQILAVPLPVTHILFQMVALETLDSIVFLDTPGNFDAGTEVKRSEVQELVQVYLKRYQEMRRYKGRNVPPNFA